MFLNALLVALTLVQPVRDDRAIVGSKAMDFALQTFDGKEVKLSDFRGQIVVLDFWASWCTPCREEMPFLDILQKKYGMHGVKVLAVNIDNKPQNALDFLKKYSIRLVPVWDREKKVVSAYDVQTMPTTMIIDHRGWIRYIHNGFTADKFPVYKQQVEKLLLESGRKPTSRKNAVSRRK